MALSAASARQAASTILPNGTSPGTVSLPAGCEAGNTVTVELFSGGFSIMDTGMEGRVPDGFEFDGCSVDANGGKALNVFRKREVTAGEQSWNFSAGFGTRWSYRVTEWTTDLEPVFPLESVGYTVATGAALTALSTGTAPAGGRSTGLVALGWHHWERFNAGVPTFSFSDFTNGFTQRDQIRTSDGSTELDDCWTWNFTTGPAAQESAATINASDRSASDTFYGLVVVYAATTYA